MGGVWESVRHKGGKGGGFPGREGERGVPFPEGLSQGHEGLVCERALLQESGVYVFLGGMIGLVG